MRHTLLERQWAVEMFEETAVMRVVRHFRRRKERIVNSIGTAV